MCLEGRDTLGKKNIQNKRGCFGGGSYCTRIEIKGHVVLLAAVLAEILEVLLTTVLQQKLTNLLFYNIFSKKSGRL